MDPEENRDILDALADLRVPTHPRVSLTELGVVYDIRRCGGNVVVQLGLPEVARDHADGLRGAVSLRLQELPDVDTVVVKVVDDPRWTPMMATPEGRRKIGFES